jgi:hypothetical protein
MGLISKNEHYPLWHVFLRAFDPHGRVLGENKDGPPSNCEGKLKRASAPNGTMPSILKVSPGGRHIADGLSTARTVLTGLHARRTPVALRAKFLNFRFKLKD